MSKKALLVGINYPGTQHQLNGCVNDVMTISEMLSRYYGFASTDKRMLTDASATTANILERLEWLIDGATPGDVLYFHYSGHGSSLIDTDYDTQDEPDGLDEILCVSGNTYISTNKGLIYAETLHKMLQNREEIFAKVKNTYHKITASASQTKDKFLRIKTSQGIITDVGHEHPFACLRNEKLDFIKAGDLTENDIILETFNCIENKEKNPYKENLGYIIGLFIGDGYFLSGKTIRFCIRKYKNDWIENLKNVSNYIEDMELKYKENKRGDLIINVKSDFICNYLKELGFLPYKSKTGKIRIQRIDTDASFIKGLLSGLFDADGSSSKNIVNYVTADYEMARIIHIFLSMFGISSSIFGNTDKLCFINMNNINAQKFITLIGFGFGEKNNKVCKENKISSGIKGNISLPLLNEYMRKWNIKKKDISVAIGLKERSHKRIETSLYTEGNIVLLKEFVEKKKENLQNIKDNISVFNEEERVSIRASMGNVASVTGKNQFTINNRWRNSDYSDIGEYIDMFLKDTEELLEKISFFDNHTKFISINSIETITEPSVMYDFKVDGIEQFEANGLLVHNCPIDLNWRDKVIKDDDFKRIFSTVPAGVNLTVVLDCCHSGSGLRGGPMQPELVGPNRTKLLPMPADITNRGVGLNLKPKPRNLQSQIVPYNEQSGLLISGCKADQTSADAWIHNKYMGACTFYLIDTLAKSKFSLNYDILVKRMNRALKKYGYTQKPELNGNETLFKKRFLHPFVK